MWDVHKMFITYIHRTQESRNTKNTYDFLVQVRNILLPLSLKVFRHKERDTIFIYWLFPLPTANTCAPCGKALESKRKSSFFGQQVSTNWLFSNFSPHFRCVTSLTSLVQSTIWDFYGDICERHVHSTRAREHLRSCLYLTKLCTRRKVLSLTKPKGKIYKTKSLGHHIT